MTKKVEDIFEEEYPTPPGLKELVQKYLAVDLAGAADKSVIVLIQTTPEQPRIIVFDDPRDANNAMRYAEMYAAIAAAPITITGRRPSILDVYSATPLRYPDASLEGLLDMKDILVEKPPAPTTDFKKRTTPQFLAERNRQHWKRRK